MSPPGDGEGRPPTGPADVEEAVTQPPITNDAQRNAAPRQCAADALRRRRLASYRLVPLESGHRDPWQPWRPETLSDKQVDGVVAAVEHLAAVGLPALVDVHTQRALWRSGHHRLVNQLRGGR